MRQILFDFFYLSLSQVLTLSSSNGDTENFEDDVEILVKLVQKDKSERTSEKEVDNTPPKLLDQQTLLISDDEAIFNFAAIASNAQNLVVEVKFQHIAPYLKNFI